LVFVLIGENIFSCDLISFTLVVICDVGDLESTQLVACSPYCVEKLRSENLREVLKLMRLKRKGIYPLFGDKECVLLSKLAFFFLSTGLVVIFHALPNAY